MAVKETTDFIRLRGSSDDSKKNGLAVSLWQGGSKIANLSQDSGINWQYNYPSGIVNGIYDLRINDLPVYNNGVLVDQISVKRGGMVNSENIEQGAVTNKNLADNISQLLIPYGSGITVSITENNNTGNPIQIVTSGSIPVYFRHLDTTKNWTISALNQSLDHNHVLVLNIIDGSISDLSSVTLYRPSDHILLAHAHNGTNKAGFLKDVMNHESIKLIPGIDKKVEEIGTPIFLSPYPYDDIVITENPGATNSVDIEVNAEIAFFFREGESTKDKRINGSYPINYSVPSSQFLVFNKSTAATSIVTSVTTLDPESYIILAYAHHGRLKSGFFRDILLYQKIHEHETLISSTTSLLNNIVNINKQKSLGQKNVNIILKGLTPTNGNYVQGMTYDRNNDYLYSFGDDGNIQQLLPNLSLNASYSAPYSGHFNSVDYNHVSDRIITVEADKNVRVFAYDGTNLKTYNAASILGTYTNFSVVWENETDNIILIVAFKYDKEIMQIHRCSLSEDGSPNITLQRTFETLAIGSQGTAFFDGILYIISDGVSQQYDYTAYAPSLFGIEIPKDDDSESPSGALDTARLSEIFRFTSLSSETEGLCFINANHFLFRLVNRNTYTAFLSNFIYGKNAQAGVFIDFGGAFPVVPSIEITPVYYNSTAPVGLYVLSVSTTGFTVSGTGYFDWKADVREVGI